MVWDAGAQILGDSDCHHRENPFYQDGLGCDTWPHVVETPIRQAGKTLVFLTNNMTLPPLTIAALYKSRWQVELFFKWIKQHLRIKRFLATGENAVKTQIWCAVSTYVLIAIIKKELHLEASLYTLLQILSVSVFEKTQLSCALQPDRSQSIPPTIGNQLILFDF